MVGSSALSYPGRISAWARGTPRLTPLAMNAFSESPHRSDCEARLIVENMPGFAWSADQNGKLTYLNQRFLEYTGKRIEDFNGGAGAARFGRNDVLRPGGGADTLQAGSHPVPGGRAYVGATRGRRVRTTHRWGCGPRDRTPVPATQGGGGFVPMVPGACRADARRGGPDRRLVWRGGRHRRPQAGGGGAPEERTGAAGHRRRPTADHRRPWPRRERPVREPAAARLHGAHHGTVADPGLPGQPRSVPPRRLGPTAGGAPPGAVPFDAIRDRVARPAQRWPVPMVPSPVPSAAPRPGTDPPLVFGRNGHRRSQAGRGGAAEQRAGASPAHPDPTRDVSAHHRRPQP